MVRESLAGTVDRVNERLFHGHEIEGDDAERVVDALLSRQSTEGSRAGMFELSDKDVAKPVQLFTGERIHTKLALRYVLSLEAGRILHLLAASRDEVIEAVDRLLVMGRRTCFGKDHCIIGECAYSSIAYMRLLAALREPEGSQWIDEHVELIRHHRDRTGRWDRFPFHYTALALVEANTRAAHAELDHADQALRRSGRRGRSDRLAEGRRRGLLDVVRERSEAAMPVLL